MARRFGAEFGAPEAAYAVGLLHDAGKISLSWQRRLLNLEQKVPTPMVDHKEFGTRIAIRVAKTPGALAVHGHHGGIPNVPMCARGEPDAVLLEQLIAEVPEVADLLECGEHVPAGWAISREVVEFGTRMLHSALVDADYLDTAAHFAGGPPLVLPDADFVDLATRYEDGRRGVLRDRVQSHLDSDRQAVYNAAVAASAGPPGVYRMSAPTGSGKTISAGGFAVHHAAAHGKRRVIVAVPFTTITEQNAAVYRHLLGDETVLEHHSAIEPAGLGERGVENWDAPFVVTTTVQLFESLFSNRPSKTRKLHRLANSVIVLDEVQALPKHLLNPILDGLRLLVEHFGATVLLASATQPTFEVLDAWRRFGVDPVEVVPDPPGLYRRFVRTSYEWQHGWSMRDLVRRIADERSSLTVVNTTATAREVAGAAQEEVGVSSVFHLSTRMCRAHRAQVLSEVRTRLANDEPVHLISTQLIEAGVDVDFPVVFRQEAPAESVIQAGGRANREGRLAVGRVVVFSGAEFPQLRDYETAIGLTAQHFLRNPGALNDPDALRRYFSQLFALQNLDASAARIQALRNDFWFEDVASEFKMIESSTTAVLVDWGDSHASLERVLDMNEMVNGGVVPMKVLRSLQPFMVELPTRLASAEYAEYLLKGVPGLNVWGGPYSALTGIGSGEPTVFLF